MPTLGCPAQPALPAHMSYRVRLGHLPELVRVRWPDLLDYCSFSLQPTKIFNYMKWKKTCDSLFMIFSAVFLISRLVVYPYT